MSYKLADGTFSTDYKVGDMFIVDVSCTFNKSSVVSLYKNDDSGDPLFKLITGNCHYDNADGEDGAWESWENMKRYVSVKDNYKEIKSGLSNFYGECCVMKIDDYFYMTLDDREDLKKIPVSRDFYIAWRKEFSKD